MSRDQFQVAKSRGWFDTDEDGLYTSTPKGWGGKRRYFVQLDGGQTTAPKWSPVTTLSLHTYLRELQKTHPDAMILRTKYS